MKKPLGLLACLLAGWLASPPLSAWDLQGDPVQGAVLFGQAAPGSVVSLDGRTLQVSAAGRFVLGFGRDQTGNAVLEVREPGNDPERRVLEIAPREYNIERVDGLPPRTVTPDPESLARIQEEARRVAQARARRDNRDDYAAGFAWPASGRLSGFYGSQRILNGEPRRPHYGVDVAAPTGSPVTAPAPGIITLAESDLYFSGGTIILDHGQGLSSSFLHLDEVLVETGDTVAQGDLIGRIGATGRASGPHLDWRMNWHDKRVDPQTVVQGSPE
jgi:murein DD-endopeptidase MepM/ murein hydrolase activator NlpD